MKTKINSLKFFTFVGMFFIFSLLTMYAFAVNSRSYLGETADAEPISIEGEFPIDLVIAKRNNCTNCQCCIGLAPDHLEIQIDDKVGFKAGAPAISASLAEEVHDNCPNDVFRIDYE